MPHHSPCPLLLFLCFCRPLSSRGNFPYQVTAWDFKQGTWQEPVPRVPEQKGTVDFRKKEGTVPRQPRYQPCVVTQKAQHGTQLERSPSESMALGIP